MCSYVLGKNIIQSLDVLSKDFDSFGLPLLNISTNILEIIIQLIDNSNLLIQQHRKVVHQLKDNNLSSRKVINDNTSLNKTIKQFQHEISSKDNSIKDLQQKLEDCSEKLTEKMEEIYKLKQDALIRKKMFATKENYLKHQLTRLSSENECLRDKAIISIGKYTSKDDIIAKELNKYKKKEEIYKETISELERNNEGLLEEIVNLKEEVVNSIRDKINCT